MNGRAATEADMQRFFVAPPSVRRMVFELEMHGLIGRISRQPRSIEVAVSAAELSQLQPRNSSVAGD
ncbi:MAG: MarR family transcriptional regulator [Polyangia bacterium]